jgi:hypothetical protein
MSARKPKPNPAGPGRTRSILNGGRRNFRLSGLEILISALILLGVIYLIAMWMGSIFTPEPEATAPAAAPATLMERALAATEKAQAQLASVVKDVAGLRKEIEQLQARRTPAPSGGGRAAATAADHALDRRLEEMDRQVQSLAESLRDRHASLQGVDVKALASRLERMEKELGAAKAAEKTAPRPAPDARLLERLERLEKVVTAQAAAGPAPSPAPSEMERRLARLEQAAARPAPAPTPAVPAAPAPAPAPAQAAPEVKAPEKPAARPAQPRVGPQRSTHKVKSGETLSGLARRYRVVQEDLVRWNAQQLGDRRQLLIGETLVIFRGE